MIRIVYIYVCSFVFNLRLIICDQLLGDYNRKCKLGDLLRVAYLKDSLRSFV